MEWLSQNWIWLAFAVGMVVMMRRGGAGGCCGGGHGAHDKLPETEGAKPKDAGTASCCGGGGHGTADKQAEVESSQPSPPLRARYTITSKRCAHES